MKKIFKIICLCGITFFLFGFFCYPTNVSAQTYALTKTYDNTYLFAVPEGGWSSITVNMNYTERYTKYDSITNKFYSRECFFAYKSAYATSMPVGNVVSIKHYTNSGGELHHFTKWNDLAVVVQPGYNGIWSKQNGKNKFYQNTTDNYAHVAFQVSCNGAVPPIQTGGLKLVLKTK